MKNLKRHVKLVTPKILWPYFLLIKSMMFNEGSEKISRIKFLKSNKKIIVLGNGPSLNNDLEEIHKTASGYDFFCVNNFCSSSYYEVFKPNKYIFLDAYFFSKNTHPDWVKQREETFNIINEKTSWKMQIFLPLNADKSILTKIIKNKNIDILKINTIGQNYNSSKKAFYFYKTGFFGPQQCNVLIYAIYLSIWASYKEIKIFGADLSFHNDVHVNQENNHLGIVFRHFDKEEDHIERLMKNPDKVRPFRMFELMQLTADTFKAHYLLKKFAEKKQIKIINSSSFSLIDTYPRSPFKN